MGLRKGKKNMAIEELEQIWNNGDVVVIAITTSAKAILEQRQRKSCAKQLIDCDLQFPNLKYARPKPPFTLISSYKRGTHAKERGSHQPRS